jgi:hypothetical protein
MLPYRSSRSREETVGSSPRGSWVISTVTVTTASTGKVRQQGTHRIPCYHEPKREPATQPASDKTRSQILIHLSLACCLYHLVVAH